MADREGRLMVTGACGQIGSELTMALRERFSGDNVVAVGHVTEPSSTLRESGPFESADVRDFGALDRLVGKHEVDSIYHLAAILSAKGEENPSLAWDVNINGLMNVLEIARRRQLAQVFVPSSIAVFGPDVPKERAPQDAVLNPATIYGISKRAGEGMARHYVRTFGLDIRGLRYPGIISGETLPGGGTTDYAVEIFYAADSSGHYQCFVREDTVLPMMYMPDCIKATLDLMDAPPDGLSQPECYNVAGMSFSAGQLAQEIRHHLPGFTCSFVPDRRQAIADSWPMRVDDQLARQEWDWNPSFGLSSMVEDMMARF